MTYSGGLPILSGFNGGCTGYPISPFKDGMYSVDGFNYIDKVSNSFSIDATSSVVSCASNSNAELFILFVLVALCSFIVIELILSCIGNYLVFKKAGEKGWKAFVPIYGAYTRYKIAGMGEGISNLYWFALAFSVIGNLTSGFVSILFLFLSLIIVCDQYMKLANKFDEKNWVFELMLFLFPEIFMLVLGLDSSYVYENKKDKSEEETKFEPIDADVVEEKVEEIKKEKPAKKAPTRKTSAKKTSTKKIKKEPAKKAVAKKTKKKDE